MSPSWLSRPDEPVAKSGSLPRPGSLITPPEYASNVYGIVRCTWGMFSSLKPCAFLKCTWRHCFVEKPRPHSPSGHLRAKIPPGYATARLINN